MPKAPKKLSTVSRRKRPKGVYAKGWETRRANRKAMEAAGFKAMGETASEAMKAAGWNPTTVAEAALMGAGAVPSEQQASRGDAVISLLAIHRDEQLSGFMADMQCIRRIGVPAHAPIMVSRSQIEAIEDLLGDLGYSMFGKGSGSLATVSTNPNKVA